MQVNNTLSVLLLNGNFIGTDGARHLMGAIKVNNTLSYLGLQVCLDTWGERGGVEPGGAWGCRWEG